MPELDTPVLFWVFFFFIFACCYCFLLSSYKFLRAGTPAYINLKNSSREVAWLWQSRFTLGGLKSWGDQTLSCLRSQRLRLFSSMFFFSFCPCASANTREISNFLDQICWNAKCFQKMNYWAWVSGGHHFPCSCLLWLWRSKLPQHVHHLQSLLLWVTIVEKVT